MYQLRIEFALERHQDDDGIDHLEHERGDLARGSLAQDAQFEAERSDGDQDEHDDCLLQYDGCHET